MKRVKAEYKNLEGLDKEFLGGSLLHYVPQKNPNRFLALPSLVALTSCKILWLLVTMWRVIFDFDRWR